MSHGLDAHTPIDVSSLQPRLKKTLREAKENFGVDVQPGQGTSAVVAFLNYIAGKQPEEYTIAERSEELGDAIHNGDTMPWAVYFGLGSAIKRAFRHDPDRAWGLFDSWSRRSGKHDEAYNQQQWHTWSDNACGFATLKNIACICCPAWREHFAKPEVRLTQLDPGGDDIPVRIVDQEHLDILDALRTKTTFFVQSPMGTGKSYQLRQLFRDRPDLSVLMLSPRQSFSSTMASEFAELGMVGYLDKTAFRDALKKANPRVIVSLE